MATTGTVVSGMSGQSMPELDPARVSAFVVAWRQRSKPPTLPSWSARLAAIERLAERLRTSPRRGRPQTLDNERLAELFKALSGSALRNKRANMPPSPWALAGLKRVEVRNAAALAGLWKCSIVGTAFLDAFLRRINANGRLPERMMLEQGYRVRIEDCPLGLASERVDITIEGERFLLGIEVKIGAGLGPLQLERYVETIRTRAGRDRRWAVVMLAPRPEARPDVVPSRWHDVAAAAEQIAEQFPTDHHAWLVSQFGAHVGTF